MYVSQVGLFHLQLLQERIPHAKDNDLSCTWTRSGSIMLGRMRILM
ncbi:unnamed protein product [Prunus brigantina]